MRHQREAEWMRLLWKFVSRNNTDPFRGQRRMACHMCILDAMMSADKYCIHAFVDSDLPMAVMSRFQRRPRGLTLRAAWMMVAMGKNT